ncbi:hypothetical protein [Piscirickettsia litoralis]|uniref:hypothetical protein n=1 Tax=Piscirickettsia litoralis TaxID=1891921 RepID=UPI001F4452CD|nr:hypothetical protein [Piscirickettsia litoralis]
MKYMKAVAGMWAHRRWLKQCLVQHRLARVTQLTAEQLHRLNVKVLALDYDGVLVSHGKTELSTEYEVWLENLMGQFEGEVCILSNKPEAARENYMQKRFSAMGFISGVVKKAVTCWIVLYSKALSS